MWATWAIYSPHKVDHWEEEKLAGHLLMDMSLTLNKTSIHLTYSSKVTHIIAMNANKEL
jgi:hypothetical protein